MTCILGLTGSIASGKSETVKLLREAGIPVFDSDAEVHSLYQQPAVAEQIAMEFPSAVADGKVVRSELARLVLGNPQKLKLLERMIHPLVRTKRLKFIALCKKQNAPLAFLDIPLLFETGEDKNGDSIVLITAPEELRRERALQRPGMTREKFAQIAARQMPDAEKNRRANHIINNTGSLEDLRKQVNALIMQLKDKAKVHDT